MANTPIFRDPFPTGSCLERVLNGVVSTLLDSLSHAILRSSADASAIACPHHAPLLDAAGISSAACPPTTDRTLS
jgi:hypothetical protein